MNSGGTHEVYNSVLLGKAIQSLGNIYLLLALFEFPIAEQELAVFDAKIFHYHCCFLLNL